MKQKFNAPPVAPQIREALKRFEVESGRDMTWKELGQRVWATLGMGAVDTSKVSRIKLGQQEPSIAEGLAFAYVLNCSPTWLFTRAGEMGRYPGREDETDRPAIPTTPKLGPRGPEQPVKKTKRA